MPEIAGSCLCGAVKYRSTSQPLLTVFCHCRSCQKSGGGGYSLNIGVPTDSITLEGTLQAYRAVGASGLPVTRRFCGQCGSPIFTEADAFPGVTIVKVSSLDDPAWVRSDVHIWCDSAQPWDPIPANATCIGGNPPAA